MAHTIVRIYTCVQVALQLHQTPVADGDSVIVLGFFMYFTQQ